ncbi:IL-18 binding protein [Akhmeta virus]|uniref:IL-18 binding protein n=1 Tax=Orthopoxvirus akhmetapox TaxID=2200830 RepID=A0A346FRB2_9POXV|nr:IL-18 binding protein [Akhmeta virus]AXN74805.1 IL-18 binding protein [Akhmeta virus]AXN75025.1 IL-18 binding protein [Akhmeta virus]QEQ49357.1 Soluble IL-18 binding protein [Akhmeta virus]
MGDLEKMRILFLIAFMYGCVHPYVNADEIKCPNLNIDTSSSGEFLCSGCVAFMPDFSYMYWLAKDMRSDEDAKFIEHLGEGIKEDETVSTIDGRIVTLQKVLRVTDTNKFANYKFTCVLSTLDGTSKKEYLLK